MGEVIEFPDKFYYRTDDDNNILGCGGEGFNIDNIPKNKVLLDENVTMDRSDLKELMIMWLALNYPDVLAFDDEGS